LSRGEIPCVIGTSVIGEGRDVPAADALVYFAGLKSRVKVTQDYYRVLTPSPGKTHGIIVDAADCHHGVLTNHAAERLMLYRSESAFAADVMEWGDFESWLNR
jgi:superfamily II DNA or RNA helicase